jgi:2-polyprenyl-3-methyl-5-hydroxy-6-metoxy-1,4-benzoquinol methylase
MVDPKTHWEQAGIVGYDKVVFASASVEQHVNRRLWNVAIDIGNQLGLDRSSHVLDLGCGDGSFANRILAAHYRSIDGFDLSAAAVRLAKNNAAEPNVHFRTCDVTRLRGQLQRYDGVFFIGILHHVKSAASRLIQGLQDITSRVIVLEPNGTLA